MDKLHIALCTDGVFPHAMGGMQRHSRLLAEHLAQVDGVLLTVFHPHEAGIFKQVPGIREVHVPGINTSRTYIRELWQYSGRMAAALHDELARPDGPAVILAQGFSVWKDIHQFSGRLMVHPHGLEMFQGLTTKERMLGWPFRQMVRYVACNSKAVVSLGGKLTSILERLVQGSPARVVVLPNAVDVPEVPPPYPQVQQPLRMLFVGRFAFNKGIDLLIGVAHRLAHEGLADQVRFDVVGSGPLLARYQVAGLPPNVYLPGQVDDTALATLYEACHALVLPTRFEGMPTVVLEAMARARPVLVSDVGAAAELVHNGRNGYLLPPGDAQTLYRAVRQLMDTSAENRRDMGLEGYQAARQHFAWPVVARLHAKALGALLDGIHR
jgi:glycosyltransferase involved in cell wall biosynthesis